MPLHMTQRIVFFASGGAAAFRKLVSIRAIAVLSTAFLGKALARRMEFDGRVYEPRRLDPWHEDLEDNHRQRHRLAG